MDDGAFHQAAVEGDIFGRISPEQKEHIVDCLLQENLRVAMMGDGVNDVLPIKKASLGIAMESGSNATRNVADMILLNDSFAALMPAFTEGRRIIGGMTNALYLFIARVTVSILLIIAITMIGLSFPFDPAQVALSTFTVGIPAFFLTLWARPQALRSDLLASIGRFVFPVAIITMMCGAGVYYYVYQGALRGTTRPDVPTRVRDMFESYTGVEFGTEEYPDAAATISAQSAMSIFFTSVSIVLIFFLEPPIRFFTAWHREVVSDRRPAYMAITLLILFAIMTQIDTVANYFGVLRLPSVFYLAIPAMIVGWTLMMRAVWRFHLFERLLGVTPPEVA